jgi:ferredoxin
MSISKVDITDSCILCALCEQICPEVFKMGDVFAEINDGVNLDEYERKIREAAESCPVNSIKIINL